MSRSGSAESAELEDIRRRYVTADREYVLDSLTGALRRIEEAFPRFGHFIMEFVQNADDAGSTRLSVTEIGPTLTIRNNGATFEHANVASLCKVGRSSKKSGETIGYLGVGFKSVFLISRSVHVTSGGYSFKFDESEARQLWGDGLPWQVIPVDSAPIEMIGGDWKTGFRVALDERSQQIEQRIRSEVGPSELRDRVLLFLRKLKEIQIEIDGDKPLKRTLKSELLERTDTYELSEVTDTVDGSSIRGRWVVFRRVVSVPEEVRRDSMTERFDRGEVTAREVIAAFRVDGQKLLVPEERGTAHMAVFSFLPLRDVATGLRFTIQADFLTGPGRSNIQSDALWNRWIAGEVLRLIVEVCVPAFLGDKEWSKGFASLLYSVPGNDPIFEDVIAGPLRQRLRSQAWFLAADGTHASLEHSLVVSPKYKDWFSPADLKLLYPDHKMLDEDVEVPSELSGIPRWISNEQTFWDHIRQLVPSKAKDRDSDWFKRIYQGPEQPPNGANGLGPILT